MVLLSGANEGSVGSEVVCSLALGQRIDLEAAQGQPAIAEIKGRLGSQIFIDSTSGKAESD
ncbi:MAG: hypothetical protein NVS4B7_17880 [Ktedonobacteraceae bacterium]